MKILKILFIALFLVLYYYEPNYAWGNKKTLKELVDQAPVIVVGNVLNVESKFEEYQRQTNFIFTYVTINIVTSLKGTTESQIIVIKIPGGQVGEQVIGGERSFKLNKDDEILLFLKQIEGSYFEIYSLSGKLSIKRNGSERSVDCSVLKDDEITEYNNASTDKYENIINRINSYIKVKGGK